MPPVRHDQGRGHCRDDARHAGLVDRHHPRRGDGVDGDRPRPRLLGPPRRRSHAGHLLHSLGHALLRAGVHLPRGHERVSLRTPSRGPAAVPARARPVARAPRAHLLPRLLDVQSRVPPIRARRRHLGDRLVHGPHERPRPAAAPRRRRDRTGDRRRPQPARRATPTRPRRRPDVESLADLLRRLLRRPRPPRTQRPEPDGALLHRPVDWRDGRPGTPSAAS